jgi:E3 ubiquitin-protein ligase SIAH1
MSIDISYTGSISEYLACSHSIALLQCDQGHAVCLACLKALSWEGSAAAARCNVSGGHHTDGYRRCKSLEDAVEAIRLTCPYAAYGCGDLLTRYFLPYHRRSCSYALTASCPRDACSFIGSAEALLDHFISVEKWPYTAETQDGKSFDIHLSDGFNVVGAIRGTSQHLLVLFVARKTFGTTISAFCICPQPWLRPPPKALKCKLELWFLSTQHDAITSFDVACTNPFYGFPDPDEFVQFFVPKSVHTDDNAAIRVTASITLFYPEA